MADTTFVMTEKTFGLLFSSFLGEESQLTVGTYDQNADKNIRELREVWPYVKGDLCQLFVKHKSFASDIFQVKEIDNVHMGKIFAVDEICGNGHITLLTAPIRQIQPPLYRVGISYASFFKLPNGNYIKPSPQLISYYKNIVKTLKRETAKFVLWPGMTIWIPKVWLQDDPRYINAIKTHFDVKV